MSYYREIYNYTFKYKGLAWATILFNLLFVIFNLLSLVLFIPVLQLIFRKREELKPILPPTYKGGWSGPFEYIQDQYNFTLREIVSEDPKTALFLVCVSVLLTFLLKNIFR